MIELDLSWNTLTKVPLAQTSHLKLMRRFTMRGNPLGRLDRSTLELKTNFAEIRPLKENIEDASENVTLLSRFVETYPELARALATKLSSANSNVLDEAEESNTSNQEKFLQILRKLLIGFERQQQQQQNHEGLYDQTEPSNEIEFDGSNENEVESQELSEEISIGSHFTQIQELDFGQCQLSYIEWSTLLRLNQLKRLFLDGNRLM